MKKKFFALLMAMILVFSMSTTALADINSPYWDNTPPQTDSPYWDNTPEIDSPSWDNTPEVDSPVVDNTPEVDSPVVDNTPEVDSPTVDNTPEVVPPEVVPPVVDSPTVDNEPVEVGKVDVTWSETESWAVNVQNVSVSGSAYEYDLSLYKDGEYVGSDYLWGYVNDEISFDVSHLVADNGEGKYTVAIHVYKYESVNGWVAKYIGESEAKTYKKPANQLATPTNFSVDVKTGKITFDQVKNAEAYDVWVWYDQASSDYKYRTIRVYDENTSDNKVETTLEWLPMQIEDWTEGYKDSDVSIYVGVCAVAKDINKVANSDYVKMLVFENKLSKEQVNEKFESALEAEDPNVAADVLYNVSNETIIDMMKTDADFAKKVEKVDSLIIEALGDKYKGVTSETKLVDASEVEVVGVAINGKYANSVELKFAEPEKKVEVDKKYENAIVLDIKLLVNGYTQEDLEAPVAITMPIPAGVSKENLVILHYHGDATAPVVIVPTVNADGTMTFYVDGFSTFVIANQVTNVSKEESKEEQKEEQKEDVKVEAPKTGDVSGTAMICSLLLLVVGIVLIMKRNSFAK